MTAHNAGARLVQCPECKRRRYSRRVEIPGCNYRWTCSQGHSWVAQGITLERVDLALRARMLPNLETLLSGDSPLYVLLKKGR